MSDIMLTGVLRMPMPDDPKDLDSVTWVQFVGRAREAADTITALQAENERLREALEAAKGRLDQAREIAGLGFPSTMCAIDAALNHTEKEEG